MGIWPKYADGTDINAVDVCNELGLIATADDSGFLNILNFPSVVEEAPRRMYSGHSSFVQNVRFLPPPVQPGSGSDQRLVPVKIPFPFTPLLFLVRYLRALLRTVECHKFCFSLSHIRYSAPAFPNAVVSYTVHSHSRGHHNCAT
jgi:hypothetical protein